MSCCYQLQAGAASSRKGRYLQHEGWKEHRKINGYTANGIDAFWGVKCRSCIIVAPTCRDHSERRVSVGLVCNALHHHCNHQLSTKKYQEIIIVAIGKEYTWAWSLIVQYILLGVNMQQIFGSKFWQQAFVVILVWSFTKRF